MAFFSRRDKNRTIRSAQSLDTYLRVTEDQAVTTNPASFSTITDLGFTAAANQDYVVECFIIADVDNASRSVILTGDGPGDTSNTIPLVFNKTSGNLMHWMGVVRNGASSGTFAMKINVSTGGTVTVKTGSIMRYRPLD